MPDPEIKKFLDGVMGVVDANSYESLCLWRENEHAGYNQREWKQGGGGPLVTIGRIDDRPICISLLVNEIGGHKILFIDATSALVDHDMIDAWLQKNMPVTAFRDNDPREPLNRTNAMNFCNIFPRQEK